MKKKFDGNYWRDQIVRSKDAHKDFFDRAKESINQYSRKSDIADVKRRLGVWWYVVESILPVYCSRIPKVEVQLRKKAGNVIDQVACVSLERATQFCLDDHFDFLNTIQKTLNSEIKD